MPGSTSTDPRSASDAPPPAAGAAGRRRLLALALPLVACHAALLASWDLGGAPVRSVSILVLAFVAHLILLPRLDASRDFVGLLAVAALLRLLLLPLPPTLSDDIVRYAWDGRVVSAGLNPYLLAPEDPELAPLRDEAWRRMPHKHVPTVYPPVALAAFAAAARLPDAQLGLKIVLAAADWIACGLLMLLAVRLGRAPGRAVAYAWSPLACLETAGMGHVDALVVVFSVAAVLFLGRRPALAGAAAAAAVASKLVPVIALPLWCLHRPGRVRFAAAAVLCTALALAPMLAPAGGVPPGLVTFGVSWEWNGPLYEPLWRLIDRTPAVTTIKAGLDELKERTGRHERWNRVYPLIYPQLLAKLLLATGFAAAAGWILLGRWRRRPPPPDDEGLDAEAARTVAATGRLFTVLLLAMATVYPWYLLWVLPWAALARHRAWLVAAAASVLSYLPQHLDGLELFPWVWGATWGPLFLLWPRSRWSID